MGIRKQMMCHIWMFTLKQEEEVDKWQADSWVHIQHVTQKI